MRITLISSGHIHNDPRYLFLANSLKQAGHDVVIFNVLLGITPKEGEVKPSSFRIYRDHKVIDIMVEPFEKMNLISNLVSSLKLKMGFRGWYIRLKHAQYIQHLVKIWRRIVSCLIKEGQFKKISRRRYFYQACRMLKMACGVIFYAIKSIIKLKGTKVAFPLKLKMRFRGWYIRLKHVPYIQHLVKIWRRIVSCLIKGGQSKKISRRRYFDQACRRLKMGFAYIPHRVLFKYIYYRMRYSVQTCWMLKMANEVVPYAVENILKDQHDILKGVDVFYGLELFWGGKLAINLAQATGKKLIIDFKELYSQMDAFNDKHYEKVIESIEVSAIKNSIILPCVSKKIVEYYSTKYSRHADKFLLLENTSEFEPYSINFKRRKGKIKFIISAGILDKSRGGEHILAIWEKLNPHNSELYLRIKNIQKEHLCKWKEIAEKTFGKSVFLISAVIEDDMKATLLDYDVGIIPYLPDYSLNHKYCCPNKFGQYANAGLAIASTNTEYITKKIKKHNLGIIYNPYDLEGAVEVFRKFITDRKALNEMRQNSHEFTKNLYNWDKSVKPFLQRLKKIDKKIKSASYNGDRLVKPFMQGVKKTKKLNIALLYIANNNAPQTVYDNLSSFKKYSANSITTIPYNDQTTITNLDVYDCVVIHYYGQVYNNFSEKFIKLLREFKGMKVIFAQDEYDLIRMNREKYKKIGVDILFSASSINETIREILYPPSLFPQMKVINYLPGYIEKRKTSNLLSIKDRPIDIFYRGNSLGVAYGSLGYEKVEIGTKMKQVAREMQLIHDIEVCITKQVYGPEYLKRMRNAKATLITESGSSIIDFEGSYRPKIAEEIKNNPNLTLEYFKAKYKDFYAADMKYQIKSIPPKAFEAIVSKTALIAYEGEYSGMLIPEVHYIPLKKDWSNIGEVIAKFKDGDYLQKMINQTFDDIVASEKFSYKSFIKFFDKIVGELHQSHSTKKLLT